MFWLLPIAMLEIFAGTALCVASLTRRWVDWCADKPFAIPYLVLAFGYWAIAFGLLHLLKLLEFVAK
ncbi:MAG TPA: hypothetical protein VE961_06925 [Pyrinomonadaceae bacterium]|nr:hypothetical protein [Pyrinomonadaceae bacterium]